MVDLPEPLGPSKPNTSPRRTSKLTLLKARTKPGLSKYRLTPCIHATRSRRYGGKELGLAISGGFMSKESKQQGYGSNQRDPGGETRQHKSFVVMQNLPSDRMHREE